MSAARAALVALVVGLGLLAGPPPSSAADRPDRPPVSGCVTWREFQEVPMSGRPWSRARIEATWRARGIYDREWSTEETAAYSYRRCGRTGRGIQVLYDRLEGRPWPWLAKTFPCPCPGAADYRASTTTRRAS